MHYLFRGVSEHLHKKNYGRLVPKKCGQIFKHVFNLSGGLTLDKGAILGLSESNAVIRHQMNQESFPTSGVSTTPFFERAKFYATAGGKYESGFIYKIDRSILANNGVIEFNVLDYTDAPCVPEDKEIIPKLNPRLCRGEWQKLCLSIYNNNLLLYIALLECLKICNIAEGGRNEKKFITYSMGLQVSYCLGSQEAAQDSVW